MTSRCGCIPYKPIHPDCSHTLHRRFNFVCRSIYASHFARLDFECPPGSSVDIPRAAAAVCCAVAVPRINAFRCLNLVAHKDVRRQHRIRMSLGLPKNDDSVPNITLTLSSYHHLSIGDSIKFVGLNLIVLCHKFCSRCRGWVGMAVP